MSVNLTGSNAVAQSGERSKEQRAMLERTGWQIVFVMLNCEKT